ncbi:hypothetical protein JJB99_13290 [Bradyrhizobium diazoefficiens]|nr:hypothetical protein [Bradyrhizobium diazoefficiens]QQO17036.1 hypothetical protein JJB99_13290 [Bradyrhizobium diazoefficiens]
MWTIFDIILFAAGFAGCWFCKDPVIRFVTGTEALIKSLEVKLAALRAKS